MKFDTGIVCAWQVRERDLLYTKITKEMSGFHGSINIDTDRICIRIKTVDMGPVYTKIKVVETCLAGAIFENLHRGPLST